MEAVVPFSVSRNGEYALYSSPDGVLKLWDTTTGALRQEYTPSAHLSATCTCLSWCPSAKTSDTGTPRRKKKRKSKEPTQEEAPDVVAIGTSAGNVLLYSTRLGDLQTQLDDGHCDRVNDICWQPEDGSLYSCSNDHNIVHWDVQSNKVKHKWKGDKSSVHSICMCSHKHLLSAGRSIKLWNTDKYELLKKFTGHATEVFRLLVVPFTTNSTQDSIDNTYFLSSALNDRIINVWHIDTSSHNKSAVASFTLPDEPVMMDVSKQPTQDQHMLLSVVTKSGQVLTFEHTLNGKIRQPIKAKVTIQIATAVGRAEIPRPIPILSLYMCDDKDSSILLAYGNFIQPKFEKWAYSYTNSDVCLIREDTVFKGKLRNESSISKVKTPDVSSDMTLLVPELMAPRKSGMKRKSSVSGEMSIEDRLGAISVEASIAGTNAASEPPKADSMAKLLLQGIQSNDKSIINKVLFQPNDTVRENTIRRMPVQSIIPLVKIVSERLQGKARGSLILLKWIKTILAVHSSYLMTFPDIVEKFSGMYQIMNARATTFDRMSRLQGKLDLILTQITSKGEQQKDEVTDQAPLLVYQEESSEDELDDFVVSQSDTELDDNTGLFDEEEVENGKEEGKESEDDEEESDEEENGEEEEESDDSLDEKGESSENVNGDEEMESD